MIRVSPFAVKLCGSRVHSRSAIFTLPPFPKASVTPSTNGVSDMCVHDAIMKLIHVAINAVERFIVLIVFANAKVRIMNMNFKIDCLETVQNTILNLYMTFSRILLGNRCNHMENGAANSDGPVNRMSDRLSGPGHNSIASGFCHIDFLQ